ncbi:LysR substrate-binding domain-containing protein [Pseudorhodoferax sp.]|uniref:LysR substrate-binding domain-containing protein n=1 Tax=Pseudorhodoferax sp. TaxID=1993553 RepID=UPI002DD6B3BD|nr:LysR substrate-binding domain-containing protein [Pseudorhodoferax sp.]
MADQGFEGVQDAAAALRRLTMSELRALHAVKAAGNISRAAQALGVSQPALSQHIREVEDKLGLSLFLRHRRGLEPTVFGAILLRLAEALRADLGIAAEELVRATRDHRRPLRIGSMPVTSGGLLAVALGRFAAEPGTPPVVLMEGPRELLLEHLLHERVDAFVGRLPRTLEAKGLVTETLFLDGAVVIASARHPLAKKPRLTMQALQDYPWIVPAEDTAFHEQISESLRAVGLPAPAGRIRSYSMLAFPAIVSTSPLLGFLPTSLFAAGTMSASLQRLPVDLAWQASPVGIITRAERDAGNGLDRLLDLLRAVAASARSSAALGG